MRVTMRNIQSFPEPDPCWSARWSETGTARTMNLNDGEAPRRLSERRRQVGFLFGTESPDVISISPGKLCTRASKA